MALEAGEVIFGNETAESRPRADGVNNGAAVTLSAGDMADVDTDSNELCGICGESDRLILDGVVVAAASGVSEGERVDGGNTTNGTVGQFETSSGGPGIALSAVGGTYHGESVPAGHAVIKI